MKTGVLSLTAVLLCSAANAGPVNVGAPASNVVLIDPVTGNGYAAGSVGGGNIGVNLNDGSGNPINSVAGAINANIHSSDIANQTVVVGPSSAAGSAIAPSVAGSAASSQVLKAGTGNLYNAYWTTTATQGWGMVFNATSAPSNGATTAGTAAGNLQDCIYVPANSTVSINYAPGPLELFSTGITLAFSSTACASLTLSATAYIHGSAQ